MTDLNDLTADLPTLKKASGEIGDIADSLTKEQQVLHRDMATFLDADWTGPAADAFRKHYHEWAESAAGLLTALGNEAALISGTMELIREKDTHITSDIDRLVQRLGLV